MRPALAAMLVVIALSACGGSSAHRQRSSREQSTTPPTLDIYSSLPLTGSDASAGQAVEHGIELALRQADEQAGNFALEYRSLNDAGRRGSWNATKTLANATRAATDPRADFYIGELAHQATSLAAPIVSNAGIAQISPVAGPFNTRPPGLFSLVPGLHVQAQATAAALKLVGCTRVALASADGTGATLRGLIDKAVTAESLKVEDNSSVETNSHLLINYAIDLKDLGVNCFVYVGTGMQLATRMASAVHAQVPHIKVLTTTSVCGRGWPAAGFTVLCTSPLLPISKYPGGPQFAAAYKRLFGFAPQNADALYGFDAAQLFLDAVKTLGHRAINRGALVHELTTINDRDSVLGSYSFDSGGDATVRYYGLYSITDGGAPRFVTRLQTP